MDKFWNILSTNEDSDGVEFISTIEVTKSCFLVIQEDNYFLGSRLPLLWNTISPWEKPVWMGSKISKYSSFKVLQLLVSYLLTLHLWYICFFISEGIQVGQYFGEFFIGQARRSNHKFESRYQYFHSWQVFKIFMILIFEGVRRKNIWFTIISHSTPDQKEGILDFNKSMFSNRFKKIFKESIKIISNSQIISIII